MVLDWYDEEQSQKVSDKDILAVEQKFGVKFPLPYREMLKFHSGDFSEQLEEMIALDEISSMIDRGEYYCLSFMNNNELNKVIPIFLTLSGDYYALDYNVLNSLGEPTVIDVSHEADEGQAEDLDRYDSFQAFISSF